MTEQLKEIAIRLKTLRQIMDVSEEELAEVCGVNLEEYRAYERGEKDFSFSFIYNAANRLGVDVVDLMSGDSPKLSNMCVVRKGKGFKINRREAYDYQHIAYTFRNKKVEPFVVTVEPKPEEEKKAAVKENPVDVFANINTTDDLVKGLARDLGESDDLVGDANSDKE